MVSHSGPHSKGTYSGRPHYKDMDESQTNISILIIYGCGRLSISWRRSSKDLNMKPASSRLPVLAADYRWNISRILPDYKVKYIQYTTRLQSETYTIYYQITRWNISSKIFILLLLLSATDTQDLLNGLPHISTTSADLRPSLSLLTVDPRALLKGPLFLALGQRVHRVLGSSRHLLYLPALWSGCSRGALQRSWRMEQ